MSKEEYTFYKTRNHVYIKEDDGSFYVMKIDHTEKLNKYPKEKVVIMTDSSESSEVEDIWNKPKRWIKNKNDT